MSRYFHRQKKARQTRDVIGVKMRNEDQSDPSEEKARLLYGKLRTLAAIDKHAISVIAKIRGRQMPVGFRHNAAAAKYAYI